MNEIKILKRDKFYKCTREQKTDQRADIVNIFPKKA